MMKVCFELVAAVREKAGVSQWILESEKESLTVFQALKELEKAFRTSHLRVTEDQTTRKDILVFLKKTNGKQKRVYRPYETGYKPGEIILLSSTMGGG